MTNPQSWLADRSVWLIVGANALTLLIALVQGWGMLNLMGPLWLQSLVICWYGRLRIVRLQRFCTEGFMATGQRIEPTPESLRQVDRLYLLTYGAWHAMLLIMLLFVVFSSTIDGYMEVRAFGRVYESYVGSLQANDWPLFVLLGGCYAWVHGVSHREHVAADLNGTPSIGPLFWSHLPRVLPMQLALSIGLVIGGGAGVLAMFALLKTVADVGMHIAEHRTLGRLAAVGGQRRPGT